MKGSRAAVRYAKSLIDLSLEKGELEKVYADMKLITVTIKESAELSTMLNSPIIKTDKKQEILSLIFGKHISSLTQAFIQLITLKRREDYLEAIAAEFIEQYKVHKNILTAVITTAQGLDDELRKQVLQVVKKGNQSEVELVEKINKDLIGGFILRVGDKQDDTSILRKIKLLERTFKENPNINAL